MRGDKHCQGLVPISVKEVKRLIANMESKIRPAFEKEQAQFYDNIRAALARPRFFGLIKGNTNPTKEQMDQYASDVWEIDWSESKYKTRLEFVERMKRATLTDKKTLLLTIGEMNSLTSWLDESERT